MQEEEPLELKFTSSFKNETVSAIAGLLFGDPLALEKAIAKLDITLKNEWKFRWTMEMKMDDQIPVISIRTEGPISFGNLTLEWENWHLDYLELESKVEPKEWVHELSLSWNRGKEPTLKGKSTHEIAPKRGWRLTYVISGFSLDNLSDLSLTWFQEDCDVTLDVLDQEMNCKLERQLAEDLKLNLSFTLAQQDVYGKLQLRWKDGSLSIYLSSTKLDGKLNWKSGDLGLSFNLLIEEAKYEELTFGVTVRF